MQKYMKIMMDGITFILHLFDSAIFALNLTSITNIYVDICIIFFNL